MLRLPEGGSAPSRRPARTAATNGIAPAAESSLSPPAGAAPAATNRAATAMDRRANLRQASELWLTRAALARNSFVSNAHLDKEQEMKFDVLMESMNLRLGERVDHWVETLKAKGFLRPEDGLRIMNDLSDALVLTYDEMDRSLPADWREKGGENFQLVNFIDPEAVMPLMELETLATNRSQGFGPPLRHGRNGGRGERQ
jgi:hypothetical protein